MNGLYRALLAVAAVLTLLVGFWMPHDAAHDAWWNRIPAFFALFGFIGCLAIIFFAKFLGKVLLRKEEDYYDAD
jgi:hypothetical protein